jgi:hypothetical protein
MKRFFRMLIQNLRTGERRTYISARQGSAPAGWKCIGVLGYYEQPSRDE